MSEIDLYLPKRLNWQSRVMAEAQRFNVVVKGRRAGGTALGEDIAIDSLIDGERVGWFSERYRILAEAERDILSVIDPLVTDRSKTEHRYELQTGGILELWSLDGEVSTRGRKYKRVIVDEAAFVPSLKTRWERQIRPTIAETAGDAWFVTSPNGHNYLHVLWERGKDPEWSTWASWQIPTWRNPIIPKSEIEFMRKELDESNFRQEIGAEFVTRSGAVFPSFRRDRHVKSIKVDHKLPVHIGIDYGFRTFAAVLFQLPSNGQVHIVGEYEETEITTADALGHLACLPFGNGRPFEENISTIGCDPAGAGRNLQTGMSDLRLTIKAFPHSRVLYSTAKEHRDPEWRAARIRDLLLSADGIIRLFVDEDCHRVIRMFENLVYQEHKEGREEKAIPVKDGVHDHLFDALGYGLVNAGAIGTGRARAERLAWL